MIGTIGLIVDKDACVVSTNGQDHNNTREMFSQAKVSGRGPMSCFHFERSACAATEFPARTLNDARRSYVRESEKESITHWLARLIGEGRNLEKNTLN